MHSSSPRVSLQELLAFEPIAPGEGIRKLMWLFVWIGIITFCVAIGGDFRSDLLWGSFFVDTCFFTGIAVGSCLIPPIFQITRAKWSGPVRRLAEANVAFLPWAFIFILTTYAGKEYLFPWARGEMEGRGDWMEPTFVYVRFAFLFTVLFFMIWRFMRISMRGDIGLLRERTNPQSRWHAMQYDGIVENWKGSEREVLDLQRKLSWNAPLLVAVYAVIYSLFVFEMIMGMDTIWYSNMFAGWIFVGNVFIGWAALAITVSYYGLNHAEYSKVVSTQQLWDLGKLTFAFCMLWGYMFFSQFLPQWYGNMPEETQWLILRTREMPWMGLGWVVFAMLFVVPFILLLSRDLKKNPFTFSVVGAMIFLGMWLEYYLLIMPHFSPNQIPFSFVDLGLFLGFLGCYVLSLQSYRAKFPFIGISHPLTYGSADW